jgi:hypothetical protein
MLVKIRQRFCVLDVMKLVNRQRSMGERVDNGEATTMLAGRRVGSISG